MITMLKFIMFIVLLLPIFSWLLAALSNWMKPPERSAAGVGRYPFPTGRLIAFNVAFLAFLTFQATIGTVDSGYRGVVTSFGKVTDRVLGEGIYLVAPWEGVQEMTVQTHAYNQTSLAASHDLQNVSTQVTVNYALDPSRVNFVYQNFRRDYEERILRPTIQEGVKAITAKYTAEELIQKRATVKADVDVYINTKLMERGLHVDQISVTDFKFSDTFNRAIEAKVTAQQEALRAENELAKVKFEAEQKVATAQAEARALMAQKEQITPMLLELRKIEMMREAVQKWNGGVPSVVMGNGAMPLMDMTKMIGKGN